MLRPSATQGRLLVDVLREVHGYDCDQDPQSDQYSDAPPEEERVRKRHNHGDLQGLHDRGPDQPRRHDLDLVSVHGHQRVLELGAVSVPDDKFQYDGGSSCSDGSLCAHDGVRRCNNPQIPELSQ